MVLPVLILLVTALSSYPSQAYARFFPDYSSAVPSPAPSTAPTQPWEGFHGFVGCHKGIKADGLHKIKKYFQYFGYINASYHNLTDEFDENLVAAVRNYQLNFNLNVTGQLDESTVDRITLPRCGNPDIVNGTSTMASGRSSSFRSNSTLHTVAHYSFFPDRPTWPRGQNQLTYAFNPGNQLPDSVRAVFARAFQRWSEVTPLTFVETQTFPTANIRIAFFRGDHGDGEPFDGNLGTLAHAFSPPSGRFHLDSDEDWVLDGNFLTNNLRSAVDLESVAVHEIGHILGLGHSSVEESIMYPTIASRTRKVDLAADDIQGIQVLYGPNPNFNGSTPTPNPMPGTDSSGSNGVGVNLVASVAGIFLFLLNFVSLL